MARATLYVVLCAVYILYTSQCPPQDTSLVVSLFPFLPCSTPSLRCSLPPPLAYSSLPSFLRSVHAYVPFSLVESFPSSTLLPFLHSRSHPPSHHSFLPPSPTLPLHPPSHPPSLLAPSLQAAQYCVAPSHVWHWDSGVFVPEEGVVSMARCYLQRACSHHVLTKSKKSDDWHVQQIWHKHGRRSYLSDGVGGDSQSLLEREPTRSKDICSLII